MKHLLLGFAALFLISSPATAQDNPLLMLPEGQSTLNISATEQVEVAQDLLIASLRYEFKSKDPRQVQNEINKKMKQALDMANTLQGAKVKTLGYNVYERNERIDNTENYVKMWYGSQALQIKGKNSTDILELTGKLQDIGLNMNGLQFSLSPEKAQEIQDGLLEDALKKLQIRAERAAKALGKNTAELRAINVGGGHTPVYQARRSHAVMAMADSVEMAAPVAQGGDTTITLTVNATAILK